MLLHALSNMVIKTIFDPLWRGTPTSNDDIDVRKSSNKKANFLFTDILWIHQLYDANIRVAYITRHGASDSNKSMVIREREWPSETLDTSFAST